MGALSGDYAYLGQPINNGIELAVVQANEAGDLACELELYVQDSQGDPNQAVPLARDLVERERLVACMCGFFSGETLATGQIFDRAGVLMASTGSHTVVDDQGFATWFRTVGNDRDTARSGTRYIKRVLKPRRIALVRDRQDYARRITRTFEKHLGWRVEDVVVINEYKKNYTHQVESVRDTRADLVLFAGYAPQAVLFLKQLRAARLDTPFMAANVVIDRLFRGRSERWARGALSLCECSYPGEVQGAADFVAAYRARYDRAPRSYAGDMYDATNLVIEALSDQTFNDSIESIRAGVVEHFDATEDHAGVIKPYTWERDGDLLARGRHAFIFRFRNDRWHMRGSVYDLTR